jgi:hypothetical protein
MRLRDRISRVERKTEPSSAYDVHAYVVRRGAGGHTRENCPKCAAMGDAEYAEYRAWLAKQSGVRVTAVEIVRCEVGQGEPEENG